jgi:hypothetical protein
MAPRFEKITTPHQQNQVLAQTKPNLLFKSGHGVCAPADTGCGLTKAWNRSNSALHKTPASASKKEFKMGSFFHG